MNERFVPVAVDNTRLQSQDDEEGQFLRLVSWQGRYQYSYADAHARRTDTKHGKNHQGLYVTTTAGELLGSQATRNPDQLLQMLRRALVNWDERKTQLAGFEIGELKRRDPEFIWTYPEDGLVLHLGCQDLARQVDSRPPDWQRDAHNQDYVWFLGAEMRAIVPADVSVGDVFCMPEVVTQRLIRYHMLDCVRGETPPWPASALRDVELKLKVTDATADKVKIRVSGHALLHEEGDWCVHPPSFSAYRTGEMCCLIRERGFDAELLGYLCFDRRAQAFSRFDLVAVGTRWGGTTFNVRREDVAPAAMGIAITLAGRAARDRTAPHISHTRKSWQRYFAL
ncbi:hypothetical protein OAF45_00935 [Candidatus Latescibacteria bacterium]|nr:hypothetical protein [Candidatus Latescibacterota bacterium]